MLSSPDQPTAPAGTRVPYAHATPAQVTHARHYLQTRLRTHFPTLNGSCWAEALALFRPDLWVAGERVVLAYPDVAQLAHHLAGSPAVAPLDPPLHGPAAVYLAQQFLFLAELAVRALPALAAAPGTGGPHLFALVRRLARGDRVATDVVGAVRWGWDVGRPLPPGLPGAAPAPGSAAAEQRLAAWALAGGAGDGPHPTGQP